MTIIDVNGYVKIQHKRDGKVINTYEGKNLVVDTGKNLFASRLKDASDDPITHMACGDDNTTPTESDTALIGTEHERVAATVTVTDNSLEVSATFGSGIIGTVTMAEYGIFNDAVAGSMVCRFVTSDVSLNATAGDTFDVTWTLQFGD